MNRTQRLLASIAFACIALAGAAPAQFPPGCFGDDGYDVGCCMPPSPNLPPFPAVTVAGAYACLQSCSLEARFSVNVRLGAPTFVACDYAVIPISVSAGAAGGPSFSGALAAKYSRTWVEIPGTAVVPPRQVWRFLLEGDVSFQSSATNPAPCPIPPCANPTVGLPVHEVGHIDYARPCGGSATAPFRVALSLTHVKCLNHTFFSERPLTGPAAHEDRSYTLVAPANFTFGPTAEPAGALVGEAIRSSSLNLGAAAPYVCHSEAQVFSGQGNLATASDECYGCLPAPVNGPRIWKHQRVAGNAACGAITVVFPFSGVPIPGIFPTGMLTLNIGQWNGANPDDFPGDRTLNVSYGVMQYTSPCNPSAFPYHIFTGVGTIHATGARLYGPSPSAALVHQFVDLQNMLVFKNGQFVPGIGALFLSTELWNLNPF